MITNSSGFRSFSWASASSYPLGDDPAKSETILARSSKTYDAHDGGHEAVPWNPAQKQQ